MAAFLYFGSGRGMWVPSTDCAQLVDAASREPEVGELTGCVKNRNG
jgi:hypothetical protein